MTMRKKQKNLKKGKDAESSVEEEILEALTSFTDALKKGDVVKRFTCRQIRLDLEPTHYSPELVRKTRKLLKVSQPLFGRFLGVSPITVRSWEQGMPKSRSSSRFPLRSPG